MMGTILAKQMGLPISKIVCMVSRDGNTGTSYWRLRDTTNNLTIGTKSWTGLNMHPEVDASLTNLPANHANFELQVKIDSSSSSGRLWSCTILRSP